MFSLMGAGQNLPDAKAVCGQMKCFHRANCMGVAAPIASMVPTPIFNILALTAYLSHLDFEAICDLEYMYYT